MASAGAAAGAAAAEPLSWTMETPGMKTFACCLTIPKSSHLAWRVLPATTVTPDLADRASVPIAVPATRLLELKNTAKGSFPHTLAVIGHCTLSKDCIKLLIKDFGKIGQPVPSKFVWPSHEAVLQCPRCQTAHKPSKAPLVLLVHFLIQRAEQGLGVRAMPRLMCRSCFDEHIEGAELAIPADLETVNAGPLPGPQAVRMIPAEALATPEGIASCAEKYPDFAEQLQPYSFLRTGTVPWANKNPVRLLWNLTTANGYFDQWMKDVTEDWQRSMSKGLDMKYGPGAGSAAAAPLKEATWTYDTTCGQCGKTSATSMKRCSACKAVHYCNAECQKLNWKVHKKLCSASRK